MEGGSKGKMDGHFGRVAGIDDGRGNLLLYLERSVCSLPRKSVGKSDEMRILLSLLSLRAVSSLHGILVQDECIAPWLNHML